MNLDAELARLLLVDHAASKGADAHAACLEIAAVSRGMLDAFMDAGFERDEAFAMVLALNQVGAMADVQDA